MLRASAKLLAKSDPILSYTRPRQKAVRNSVALWMETRPGSQKESEMPCLAFATCVTLLLASPSPSIQWEIIVCTAHLPKLSQGSSDIVTLTCSACPEESVLGIAVRIPAQWWSLVSGKKPAMPPEASPFLLCGCGSPRGEKGEGRRGRAASGA